MLDDLDGLHPRRQRRQPRLPAAVETVGRRGEEFVVDWFTDAERALVDSMREVEDRSRLVTTVWSAKESALKALGVGLRMDTRDVNVELLTDRPQTPDVGLQAPDAGQRTPDSGLRAREEWSPLMVTCSRGSFHGWSRTCEIVVYEPGREISWRTIPSLPLHNDSTIWTLTVEPEDDGTRITHRLTITGPGADEVGPALGPQISADFPDQLDALVDAARRG